MSVFDPETVARDFDLDLDTARLACSIARGDCDPLDLPEAGAAGAAARRRVRECYHRPEAWNVALYALDALLGTFGVEGWARSMRSGVSYCNTGDTYAPTFVYDTDEGWLYCSWGDLAEVEAARERDDEHDGPDFWGA